MDVALISNQVEQKFGDACSRIYGDFADSTSRTLQQYFEDFTAKACSLLHSGFANVVLASQSAFEQCCREAIEESARAMREEFSASLRRSLDTASGSLASKLEEEQLQAEKELKEAKELLCGGPGGLKMEEAEPTDVDIAIASAEAGPSSTLFEEALKSFNMTDFAAFTKQAELMTAGDLLSPPPSVPLPLLPPAPPVSPIRPARRSHACSFCGQKFSLRTQLRRHLRSHLGESTPCMEATGAGMATVSADVGEDGVETVKHEAGSGGGGVGGSGARPFACDLCGRAFNKRWNLTAHLRIHTDERPFVCELCNKAFRRKSCLVIHRRSHSREKPFSCGVCGKSFADGSSRNKHQRLHVWLEQPTMLDGVGTAGRL